MTTNDEQPQDVLAKKDGDIALLTLNRPDTLNALDSTLLEDLADKLEGFDADDEVRCVVLGGSERAFAAGADIKEMSSLTAPDLLGREGRTPWQRITASRKPVIAAVSGYALGGGCELALACDMIVASETAQFGLPEINLGVIPGGGGTQRLTHAIGKARAMELVLTGRRIDASEAFRAGMLTKVAPTESYLDEAKSLARNVAEKAPLAVQMGKDAVLKSYDAHLGQGIDYEQRNFLILFSTEDKEEGMSAFVEKRRPEFKGR